MMMMMMMIPLPTRRRSTKYDIDPDAVVVHKSNRKQLQLLDPFSSSYIIVAPEVSVEIF
ncbi:unnamed protein product [Amoebophrya sp. A25]|nr:unnamed protein product [Amoebophrya sp. A25]|eukprot:GSA25T00013720001.1